MPVLARTLAIRALTPTEPALGFSEKTPGLSPKKSRVPHRHVDGKHQQTNKSFRPTSPGVARTFFRFYVIYLGQRYVLVYVRFRLRYVTVAGATFFVYVTLP